MKEAGYQNKFHFGKIDMAGIALSSAPSKPQQDWISMLEECGTTNDRIEEIRNSTGRYFVRGLSFDARLVSELIGICGYVLRIDHGSCKATLLDTPSLRGHRKRYGQTEITRAPSCDVPEEVANELIESGAVSMLTEFEENWRYGWRDIGVDGTGCNLYLMSM